ncbi:hypothetical protein ACVXHA_07965 [Escherichia coli]
MGKPYPLLNLAYVGDQAALPCLPRLEKRASVAPGIFFTNAKRPS